MSTAEIPVEGMTCRGCARAVSFTMSRLAGVESVDADSAAGLVRLSYHEQEVSEQRLREALRTLCGLKVAG